MYTKSHSKFDNIHQNIYKNLIGKKYLITSYKNTNNDISNVICFKCIKMSLSTITSDQIRFQNFYMRLEHNKNCHILWRFVAYRLSNENNQASNSHTCMCVSLYLCVRMRVFVFITLHESRFKKEKHSCWTKEFFELKLFFATEFSCQTRNWPKIVVKEYSFVQYFLIVSTERGRKHI